MRAVLGAVFQPADSTALCIAARIALCGHDNRQSVVIGPIDAGLVQSPFGAGQHQVQRLRAQPYHQNLTFRVAKNGALYSTNRARPFSIINPAYRTP